MTERFALVFESIDRLLSCRAEVPAREQSARAYENVRRGIVIDSQRGPDRYRFVRKRSGCVHRINTPSGQRRIWRSRTGRMRLQLEHAAVEIGACGGLLRTEIHTFRLKIQVPIRGDEIAYHAVRRARQSNALGRNGNSAGIVILDAIEIVNIDVGSCIARHSSTRVRTRTHNKEPAVRIARSGVRFADSGNRRAGCRQLSARQRDFSDELRRSFGISHVHDDVARMIVSHHAAITVDVDCNLTAAETEWNYGNGSPMTAVNYRAVDRSAARVIDYAGQVDVEYARRAVDIINVRVSVGCRRIFGEPR